MGSNTMETETNIELDDGRTVHKYVVEADGNTEAVTGWVTDDRSMRFETEGGESGTVRKASNGMVKFGHKLTVCGISGVKKLPADDEWIETMNDELEAKREAYRAAEREKELTFTVRSHESNFDGHKTSTLVLSPGKSLRTDDEDELIDTLADVLGTIGGGARSRGDIQAFESMEAGDEITAEEARERLDAEFGEEQDEREAEQEREAECEDLREDHPELRRVSFDPNDARAALNEAADSGQSVVVATSTVECNGEVPECSADILTARATFKGGIDIKRTHTR